MRNLTTTLLIKCLELLDSSLKQTMHDPSILLNANALIKKVSSVQDAYKKQVVEYFIIKVLAKLYSNIVVNIQEQEYIKPLSKHITYLIFLISRRLDPILIDFYQCSTIYKDKGTINSTYSIYNYIQGIYYSYSISLEDRHFYK